MYAILNDAGDRGAWISEEISSLDLQSYVVYDCPNSTIAQRIVVAAQRLDAGNLDASTQENEQRVLRLAYKFKVS